MPRSAFWQARPKSYADKPGFLNTAFLAWTAVFAESLETRRAIVDHPDKRALHAPASSAVKRVPSID